MMHGDGPRTVQDSARRYAAADFTGIDRERLLLLVLEGGQRFLRLAREALATGDVARFAENLGRGQAILAELQGTLDHAAGGAIAADLHRLYDYMLVRLTEANVARSTAHVDEVLGVFGTIVDGYRTVLGRGHATVDG